MVYIFVSWYSTILHISLISSNTLSIYSLEYYTDITILSATNAQPYSRRVALYQANLTLIPKLEKKNKHKHKLRTRLTFEHKWKNYKSILENQIQQCIKRIIIHPDYVGFIWWCKGKHTTWLIDIPQVVANVQQPILVKMNE